MKITHITHIILILSLVGVGAEAYKLNEKNKKHEMRITELDEQAGRLNETVSAMRKELAEHQTARLVYQKELALLKRMQVKQKAAVAAPIPAMELQVTQSEGDASSSSVQNSVESPQVASLLAMAQRMQSGVNIEEGARQKFEREDVDAYWAYEYEAKIRDFIAVDQNNSFEVRDLTCKTSACELKISATESNAAYLGTLFSKKLGEQAWRNKEAMVLFNQSLDEGTMSILIGRDGTSFD